MCDADVVRVPGESPLLLSYGLMDFGVVVIFPCPVCTAVAACIFLVHSFDLACLCVSLLFFYGSNKMKALGFALIAAVTLSHNKTH